MSGTDHNKEPVDVEHYLHEQAPRPTAPTWFATRTLARLRSEQSNRTAVNHWGLPAITWARISGGLAMLFTGIALVWLGTGTWQADNFNKTIATSTQATTQTTQTNTQPNGDKLSELYLAFEAFEAYEEEQWIFEEIL